MLPLATCCHIHYYLHPFHLVLLKFKNLAAKQHPDTNGTSYLSNTTVEERGGRSFCVEWRRVNQQISSLQNTTRIVSNLKIAVYV